MSAPEQTGSTISPDSPHRAGPRLYSVPRRYDLATLFTVTLAYSLLFGLMQRLGMPPIAAFVVAGFITVVGIGQALLFRGNAPRLASVVIGAVVPTVLLVVALAMKFHSTDRKRHGSGVAGGLHHSPRTRWHRCHSRLRHRCPDRRRLSARGLRAHRNEATEGRQPTRCHGSSKRRLPSLLLMLPLLALRPDVLVCGAHGKSHAGREGEAATASTVNAGEARGDGCGG